MNVVLDTNVLVSAVWSPGRNAYNILNAAFAGRFILCYDHRILEEYERVLRYPKLGFTAQEVNAVLDPLLKNGFSVVAEPIAEVSFARDETDRKFYEVAKHCRAVLISGNLAHFPPDPDILSPAEFCRRYL